MSIQCVVGTGDLPLTFTWLKDSVPIQPATSFSSSSSSLSSASSLSPILATISSLSNNIDNAIDKNHRTNGKLIGSIQSFIDHENRITIRQNDEFTSALSISSITRSQGGEYKCIVENDADKTFRSDILRVNGKFLNSNRKY